MSRQKKITIFAGIILLAAGIIALSFYFGNQEKEERHRQGTAQREEQAEEPDTEITEHFTEVWQSATSNAPWKRFTIRGHLELIIAWLSRKAAATIPIGKKDENAGLSIEDILKREKLTYSRTQDPRITALVDYIINHIDEEFTASKLSEMADLSESSMRRLFVKYTGKSPLEFVQDLRLVIAARRMLVTNERISSIAYSVGISNPNYFSRIFREKFGVSPHVYRKNAD